jgi:hypothetical protein
MLHFDKKFVYVDREYFGHNFQTLSQVTDTNLFVIILENKVISKIREISNLELF